MFMERGDVITILGPNGGGKTSLVKAIAGINKSCTGSIVFADNIKIGYMPQNFSISNLMPITVEYFLLNSSLKRLKNNQSIITEAIELVGIGNILKNQVLEISAGQTQLLLLARCLIAEPDLIILDEPVSAMDINARAKFYDIINKIAKKRLVSILMTSHDLNSALPSSDYQLRSKMIQNILRLLHITTVLTRYNILPYLLPPSKKSINKIQGHKLKCALEKLGPVFIKFGQSISSRTDVLNEDITNNLLLICDRLPSFSHKIAVKTIESEFNCKLSDIFSSFSEKPIAAASISQVHRAVTTEGKEVAVKVLRPNIEKTFSRDIKMLSWLAEIAEKFSEQSKRLKPIELVKTFAEICRVELDLRFEAAHSSELKENTKDDRGFYVPEVDWNRTSRKVLTLEWIEATPIYEVEKLNNRKQIAINLIESFCSQVYRDCFFHADMHPGNLMVDSNNNIIALDCGIMGRIDRETCYYVIEILKGFLNRDYDHVAKMHFKAGYVSSQHRNFVTACRAIGEPIIGQPIQKISFASLLAQLLKITGDFDMKVQTQLLLLQKTMILLEGTCRKIYPEINMWKVVEAWISSQHESKIGSRVENVQFSTFFIA
ncbi:probable protein kinase UbiB [Trichonephila clavata]|uniref:Probable protein kinase UbiB n=1 Tax=Trichonephila clavata TaxID=2740835 RepID=A0A8X6H4L8_TRICU|nr:probable protein kinase UbiB [Trichonephila clavata]